MSLDFTGRVVRQDNSTHQNPNISIFLVTGVPSLLYIGTSCLFTKYNRQQLVIYSVEQFKKYIKNYSGISIYLVFNFETQLIYTCTLHKVTIFTPK